MSDEVTDIHIKATPYMRAVIAELCQVQLGDKSVKLYTVSDITREAIYKGLSLMVAERMEAQRLFDLRVKEGGKRVHASLSTKVTKKEEKKVIDEKEGSPQSLEFE